MSYTQTKNQNHHRLSSSQINRISEIVSENFSLINEELGCGLRKSGRYWAGKCPVHAGENNTALNYHTTGDFNKSYWKCWTKHCEKKFFPTGIGFVRGVLSQQAGKDVSFGETLSWIIKFLKIDTSQLKNFKSDNFDYAITTFNKAPKIVESKVTKTTIRNILQMPVQYEDFTEEVLNRFDVGLCINTTKEMYGRLVVPVYDNTGYYMVASTSRTLHPKCSRCGQYHDATMLLCPTENVKQYQKWFHSSGSINSFLYNYWNVKKRDDSELIIVEGPKDVWRLTQLGIENVVAIFGTSISEEQEILLEMLGLRKLIVLLDMDDAGRKGAAIIADKYKNFYKIECPTMTKGQPADYKTKEEFLADVKISNIR